MPPINNTWGQRDPEGVVRRLTTPTGSECDAMRTGVAGLVKAGVLGEADGLTAFVDKRHIRRVRGGKGADHEVIDVQSLLSDPDQLGKIVMMIDRSLPGILVDPVVRTHFVDLDSADEAGNMTRKLNDDERAAIIKQDGPVVFTDQIPLEDKMYLFNWSVGGSADAERFLEESSGAVATVEHGQGVSRKAKRNGGPKRKHG